MTRRLPSCRLHVQTLEDRAVPANNLTFVNTASVAISVSTVGDTTTIATTDLGAQLGLATLIAALDDPDPAIKHVIVTTAVAAGGTNGNEAGSIMWNDPAGEIDGLGSNMPGRTLTLRTAADATVGAITLNGGVRFRNLPQNGTIDLVFDTSATNGQILLRYDGFLSPSFEASAVRHLTLNAGSGLVTHEQSASVPAITLAGSLSIQGGAVTLKAEGVSAADDISIQAASIQVGCVQMSSGDDLTLAGPVTLIANTVLQAAEPGGSVQFLGTVDGPFDLTIRGPAATVNGAIGLNAPLQRLQFDADRVFTATQELVADEIHVGKADGSAETALESSGIVRILDSARALYVHPGARLAPGGLATTGKMTVVGDLVLAGDSTLTIDLGATPDLVDVQGDVAIESGARLGDISGTGSLVGTSPVSILNYSGSLTGEFINAPVGGLLFIGSEAARLAGYGPAKITLEPIAADPDGQVVGVDEDGTRYLVRLTGGGTLAVGTNDDGGRFLFVRDSTPTSRLEIRTTANASDDLVAFAGGLIVQGPLAALFAPRVDFGQQLQVTGPVQSLTFRDFQTNDPADPGIILGGSATTLTAIRARNVLGDLFTGATLASVILSGDLEGDVSAAGINRLQAGALHASIGAGRIGRLQFREGELDLSTTGPVASIAVAGNLAAEIDAASIGSVRVAGTLGGQGESWDVTNGIGSIRAGAIDELDVNARYLGRLLVPGNSTMGLSGDLLFSQFNLSGNDGTAARRGLGTMKVAGNVIKTVLAVQGGHVGNVIVGRFLNSWLHLNYTPAGAFNTGGTFGSDPFRLASFRTTATTLGDPAHLWNYAFQESQIVADTIGTLLLSGLRTDGDDVAFGVKVRTGAVSVKVQSADDAAVPLNVNLAANTNPIAGDFFYLNV